MPKDGIMAGLIIATVVITTFLATSLLATSLVAAQGTPESIDWKSNWAVEPGFDINIDAAGFQFPTSIAFVPHPGDSPKDPLYFVTELRGSVKVVTNDRTVLTFAEDFFILRPDKGEVRIID